MREHFFEVRPPGSRPELVGAGAVLADHVDRRPLEHPMKRRDQVVLRIMEPGVADGEDVDVLAAVEEPVILVPEDLPHRVPPAIRQKRLTVALLIGPHAGPRRSLRRRDGRSMINEIAGRQRGETPRRCRSR